MSELLMLIGVVMGTTAFISLIRPLPRLWLPTRKRAALVWVVSFILLSIGGALRPTPTVEDARRAQGSPDIVASPPGFGISEEPADLSENTERLLALYQELHTFKDAPEFHQVGFGVCCRFNDWQKRVKELQSKTKLETFMDIEVLPGDLLILGSTYMRSKGRPTEYTETMEPKWKAGLAKKSAAVKSQQ